MSSGLILGDDVVRQLRASRLTRSRFRLEGWVQTELWRPGPGGVLRRVWRDVGRNLVVNTGINYILQTALSGSAPDTTFFLGLKDTGTVDAGDTMASHGGWATITPYSDATDPAWTEDDTGGDEAVSNSAAPASFSINATDEVFGAFLKDNDTKGGATGTLIAAKDFSASVNVLGGDTLTVTYTITGSSS
jgi:hypothetical protein